MSRVLNRPMFRLGGSTSGITSGLDKPKRGRVDEPGGYAGIDYDKAFENNDLDCFKYALLIHNTIPGIKEINTYFFIVIGTFDFF